MNLKSAVFLNNLAMSPRVITKSTEAIKLLKKAIKLDPKQAEFRRNLGLVYNQTGNPKKALENFLKCQKLKPDFIQVYFDIAVTYNLLKNSLNANKIFKKLIKLAPNSPWTYQNIAINLMQQNKIKEAINYFKKCLKVDPNFIIAYSNLYLAYKKICDWKNADKVSKILDKLNYEDPYVSLVRSEDPAENQAKVQNMAKRFKSNHNQKIFDHTHFSHKKIRLGYLSRDYKDHVMGQFISELFTNHDRSNFEIYLYSYGENDNSFYRKRFENNADYFRDIILVTDLDVAKLIYSDEIDILIDLNGFTRGSRLGILTYKPSPIQISYLGFPGSTGADFIDYNIVDKITVPDENIKYYSEKLIFLPDCCQINPEFKRINFSKFKKSDFNLPNNSFVFSSFNQSYKYDPIMFKVWLEIITAVPNSILWLPDPGTEARKNLVKFAKKNKINPNKIIFAKRLDKKEDHLSRLSLTDLALDTNIFGGHATTTDYLRAGVPVITRSGDHFISRISSSILTSLGLETLIAKSLYEYKSLAINLANNPNKLKVIRKQIQKNIKTGSLFNPKYFVGNLEKAYDVIYKNCLDGNSPHQVVL